jgi:hypothetical protein
MHAPNVRCHAITPDEAALRLGIDMVSMLEPAKNNKEAPMIMHLVWRAMQTQCAASDPTHRQRTTRAPEA